jgi:hypothetical protein
VAIAQVRGGLSACLRHCWPGTRFARSVSGFLQSQAAAFEPRCPNAGSRLLRPPAAARGSLNFATVVGAALRSGYVPRRDAPTTAYYNINRQRLHLSRAKHCLDEAGRLCFFPANPPKFNEVPFSYYLIDPIKKSLIAAGLDRIVVSVVRQHRSVADFSAFARGVVFGSPVLDQIRQRGGAEPTEIQEAVAAAMRHEFGREPSVVPTQAIVFEARNTYRA